MARASEGLFVNAGHDLDASSSRAARLEADRVRETGNIFLTIQRWFWSRIVSRKRRNYVRDEGPSWSKMRGHEQMILPKVGWLLESSSSAEKFRSSNEPPAVPPYPNQ